MRPRIIFALACLALAAANADIAPPAPAEFAVAAYLPEWRYEGANYADILRTVTHLIFFSLEVGPGGGLAALDRLPRKELLDEARAAADASGRKLLMCIGGNGRSAGFAPMVASKKARRNFIQKLKKLCALKRFDGVDLNWEYPGYTFGRGYASDEVVAKEYKGLRLLLEEMAAAFGDQLTVTLAYYPDGRQEKLLRGIGAEQHVSLLHAMSYDQGSRHSTWECAAQPQCAPCPGLHHIGCRGVRRYGKQVAEQAVQLLPAPLVTLGLPFYGRRTPRRTRATPHRFRTLDPAWVPSRVRHMQTGDWKSYEDLVQQHAPLAPGVDEAGGQYFNGPDLIARKAALARRLGLGGVMIWEVGQDCRVAPVTHGTTTHVATCPEGEASALLAAVRRGIAEGEAEAGGGKEEL